MRKYLKNPPFKKTIAQEIKTEKNKNAINVPPKNSIKKLWWSKYEPELKNPKSK